MPAKGQSKLITACEHANRKHFSKGMCKACYFADYYRHHDKHEHYKQRSRDNYYKKKREDPEFCRKRYQQIRNSRLRSNYGIDSAKYAEMLAQQGGVCAICSEPPGPIRHLAVDHDHKTGAVRGLLCDGCNTGIGNLRDRVDLLQKAIEYLKPELAATA